MADGIKPLSKMTKSELLERAKEFETMYSRTHEEKQKLNVEVARLRADLDAVKEYAENAAREGITYQYLHLSSVQTSKVRKDALQNFRHLHDFREREIMVLTNVKDHLRLLCKKPVHICPRCGDVHEAEYHADVLCDGCARSIGTFKDSE